LAHVPRFDDLGGQRWLYSVETIWTYHLTIDAAWVNQAFAGGWYLPGTYLGVNAIGRYGGLPSSYFGGVSTSAFSNSATVPFFGSHTVLHDAAPPPAILQCPSTYCSTGDWVGSGTMGLVLDVEAYTSNSIPTLMRTTGEVEVEVRYHFTGPSLPWNDLGGATWVPDGSSVLTASGAFTPSSTMNADLLHAAPGAPSLFALGGLPATIPLFGGTLVMDPFTAAILVVLCDGSGSHSQPIDLPAGIPVGTEFFVQHWTLHPDAPGGLASSNGISVVVQ